jgi:uncharacterized membrane protein YagU involved in acid resistance
MVETARMSASVAHRRHTYTPARVAQQAAIGIAAGLIGGLAMNLFADAAKRARKGHGVQQPQSKSPDDPAEIAGAIVYRAVIGHKPRSKAVKRRLGSAMHYAFSAGAGLAYALIAGAAPALRAGFGTLFGAMVWAIADEGVTPALGLSKDPREVPLDVHLFALFWHGVFGATVEGVTRCADSITA